MQYRKLGRTNLEVSAIGVGGLHFSGLTNVGAVELLIRAADLGINLVEVGRAYKTSEEKAGYVVRKNRHKYIVASKTPFKKRSSALEDIDASLHDLKTDYIDLYQLHQVDSCRQLDIILGPDGALEALKLARKEGKIRYLGITGHSPAVLLDAVKTGEFDTVQVLFNAVEREVLTELLPYACKTGVGILGMKPFGGGAFLEKGGRVAQILEKYAESTAEALLGFALSFSLSTILVGVRTLQELERNAAVAESFQPFPAQELDEMARAIDAIGMREKAFCHRCGYCLCCPNRIDIPLILRLDEYFHKYGSRDWPLYAYSHIAYNAGQCIRCGLCETKCPFKLPVMDMLKDAHLHLGLH